jgi:enterochelin esterase family protein
MIVVMPHGHWPNQGNMLASMEGAPGDDPFGRDLTQAVIPYIEAHYRVRTDANSRALAGLSMGGMQTLAVGLSNLDRFRYLGVFSSGFFSDDALANFERHRGASLAADGNDLRLFYIACGSDDFLLARYHATMSYLDGKGVRYVRHDSAGGHTWTNWRDYLHDFAPRLFR